MEDMERCIMELVVNGGNVRSMAIEALGQPETEGLMKLTKR